MLNKFVIFVISFMVVISVTAHADNASDQKDHQDLRNVLHTITDAINTQDYDKMLPVIADDSTITPINQETLHGKKEVSEYFKKWFGPGRKLAKLNIEMTADKPTEFMADNHYGVVYGDAVEKYTLNDGRRYDMKVRWTATMEKDNGQWKVRTFHAGTDFLDNPILSEAEGAVPKYAAIAFAVGLLGGLGLYRVVSAKNKG